MTFLVLVVTVDKFFCLTNGATLYTLVNLIHATTYDNIFNCESSVAVFKEIVLGVYHLQNFGYARDGLCHGIDNMEVHITPGIREINFLYKNIYKTEEIMILVGFMHKFCE